MPDEILRKMYEHNAWANLAVIRACSALTDAQLDAPAGPEAKGSIRMTLWHLVSAEQRYLARLTGFESPFAWDEPPAFDEMEESITVTGAGFAALAENEPHDDLQAQFDGEEYTMRPWVVLLQVINHGTEHREQIKNHMTALGLTPPEIDGWTFGAATDALVPAR